jgi:hypothetical protein
MDCEYIDQCYDCRNCFACVGLKKQQFCILNKKYEEDEYHRKIVEIQKKPEHGLWFPQAMAYNGYNCSLAQLYYPLNKMQIKEFSSFWEDVREKPFKLIPQEEEFYKKNNIPLPQVHPEKRSRIRYKFMTTVKSQNGTCCQCHKNIIHYYPAEWAYKNIICNNCYGKSL